jgi:hypothetical protein
MIGGYKRLEGGSKATWTLKDPFGMKLHYGIRISVKLFKIDNWDSDSFTMKVWHGTEAVKVFTTGSTTSALNSYGPFLANEGFLFKLNF